MQTTQKILKYLVWAGLFLIPFIPFIVPSGMFFPFITGKGFTFRIIVELVFGLFVALAFIAPEYRPKMTWVTKSVLIFIAAIFVADLLSANPYKSFWSNYERMEGFVLIAHLALYYIVTSSVFDSKRWNYFWNTSIIASVLASFYGFLQIAGKFTINQGGVRVDATFGNATYFAIYLVFHIFLCLYMIVQANKETWQKWGYGAAILLESIVLYYTATRGAILGLIGGLFLAGLVLIIKEKENIRFKKIGYGVIGAIVVLTGVFIGIRQTSFVQNSPVLVRFASLGPAEIKTQGRYFVWPMALKGFYGRPIFGWGQESFNFVFNKYYDPRMYGQEQWFDRTHDIFLDWLIAGGIVGLLAYLSMFAALLYYIWRGQSKFTLTEKSIFTGMIAAYLFHNIFVFDNLVSYVMFFSVLAFVHSRSVEGEVKTSPFYTRTVSSDMAHYVVLPISIIVAFVAVYWVNIPAIAANKTLISAITPQGDPQKNLDLFKQVYSYNSFGSGEATEQLVQIATQISSAQADPQVTASFVDYAKQKIDEKVAQSPHDARYLMFAGSFYNRLGMYDKAIDYLTRALAESPKKQTIFFELSSAYLGKGNLSKMSELIGEAYNLETTSPESKVLYYISAIYTKNTALIQQLNSEIDRNLLLSDNRILQAFANMGDYNTAIAILNARLEKDPNNTQNQLALASAYATVGQKQKAIDIINTIIAKNPTFKDQGEAYIKQIQGK